MRKFSAISPSAIGVPQCHSVKHLGKQAKGAFLSSLRKNTPSSSSIGFFSEQIAEQQLQPVNGDRLRRFLLCQPNQTPPYLRPVVPARFEPPTLHETSSD